MEIPQQLPSWMVLAGSIAGSLLLGVMGNLVTPLFQRYLDRTIAFHRSRSLRSRARRREFVLRYFGDKERRASKKVDALIAMNAMLVAGLLGLLALSQGSAPTGGPLHSLIAAIAQVLGWIILGAASVILLMIMKVIDAIWDAEARENALRKHSRGKGGDLSKEEELCFLDDWDMKHFGVCSKHASQGDFDKLEVMKK